MSDDGVPPAWFESLYRDDPDPWRFASSDYERAKYAATLAALGDETIGRAWEVGCSIGVFTEQLAARCDALLAVDVADAALDQARRRCAGLPGVEFRRARVPRDWPAGEFDVIVFSEVLYFLSPSSVRLTARRAVAALTPRGRVVLVNWTGDTGQTLDGEGAATLFQAAAGDSLASVQHTHGPGYRLDVYRKS